MPPQSLESLYGLVRGRFSRRFGARGPLGEDPFAVHRRMLVAVAVAAKPVAEDVDPVGHHRWGLGFGGQVVLSYAREESPRSSVGRHTQTGQRIRDSWSRSHNASWLPGSGRYAKSDILRFGEVPGSGLLASPMRGRRHAFVRACL